MLASILCNIPRVAPVRRYVLPSGKVTTDKEKALAELNGLREETWDTGDVPVPVEAKTPRKKQLKFPARAENAAEAIWLDDDEEALLAVLAALSTMR